MIRQLFAAGIVLGSGSAWAQSAVPAQALPEVQVQAPAEAGGLKAPYAGGQVARGGSLGLLGQQDVMNTPFSTVNYTSKVMEDQQARTLADVVINDASVRMTTGHTGFDDTFTIRGFAVSAQDVAVNGLYGLISQNRVPAQIAERAEVLKGPGALMNGIAPTGSIGGSLGIYTKRADDAPLNRVIGLYQSQSNLGVGVDLGRRFGENNAWGVRFNGQVRNGEASIDNGNQRGGFGALALDYRSRRLRWSLDAIQQKDSTENFRPQISLLAGSTVIPAAPNARSNWYPGTNLVQRDSTIMTRIEYDLSDSLSTYAAIGYRDGMNDQSFPRSTTAVDPAGNFTVQNTYYDSYTKTTSATAGLNWKFATASVGHNVNLGLSSMFQESGNAFIVGGSAPSNIYNPVPLPAITLPRTEPIKSAEASLNSFALADTLSFDQGRWLLTVGARKQTVGQDGFSTVTGQQTSGYGASAISPLAGLVFKPVSNVSLYGNYMTGLSRGSIVGATFANAGQVLAPFKTKNYEAGVKVDLGKITTTAAVYQLARPAAQADASNVYGYFGEQRNRGVELSAYGEIQRGLRGMASLAYNDAKLTSTAGGVFQGNKAAGMPDTTATASLDWDTPWVSGLSLNGRAVYTSGAYTTNANIAKFDPWTRWDIGARYRTLVNGKAVVLRANLENLFNKNYWLTTGTYVTVASPRTLLVSATVDF
jgi:iron complex outermembrane receptor protein